uniref:Magnesium transporter NIPA2 n=1 Tax=Taenia asiatica TaxID=60517 RepID=A0A158R9T3_TAEAS
LATDEFTSRTTSTSYLAVFSPPIDALALLLVLPCPKYVARPCDRTQPRQAANKVPQSNGRAVCILVRVCAHCCIRRACARGDGGYQYLCDWVWWLGLILMGLGEAANFAGYTFAPASLVTPMGGLSVLVSAVFSSHFLGERLNFIGKIGCVVCICGSTMVVLHAPKEQEVQSLHELSVKVLDPGFLTYTIAITVAGVVSIFVIAPKFGTRNPLVFVFISGSIGSLSVMACKGIGLGFKEAIEYGILAILRQWIFWFFLIGLVFCLTVQLNYLNRALDIFNTSIVTPLLYVFFTAFVLIASTILFKEGSSLSPTDYIGNAVGLVCIVSGIVLLTLFRDMNVSLSDLVKDFMGPVPTRVVHLSGDLSFKHRFSPTWCKRKGRGLADETYTLLSTSNECSASNESSHSTSPNHDMVEYPKLERHHQGVHQRTGSGASVFNFASVAVTTENYSTVSETGNINHSTIWTSM